MQQLLLGKGSLLPCCVKVYAQNLYIFRPCFKGYLQCRRIKYIFYNYSFSQYCNVSFHLEKKNPCATLINIVQREKNH